MPQGAERFTHNSEIVDFHLSFLLGEAGPSATAADQSTANTPSSERAPDCVFLAYSYGLNTAVIQ